MPVKPATLPKLGPLVPSSRFRLGQKSYALTACVCLYRFETEGGKLAEFLVLTPDMRFAHVARPVAETDIRAYAAVELTPDEARDFLLAHGESDLVDDFPDLFTLVDRAGKLTGDTPGQGRVTHNTAH